MNIIDSKLEFNSNYSKRNVSDITRIILHHTAVTVLQSVETIHNYHKSTKGYAGIGYHFYIRKGGGIYKGREVEMVGAHAYNNNSNSIGICCEGNFEVEEMPDAQKTSLIELIEYLLKVFPKINTIQGHKEVNATTCPGKNYPLEEMKNLLNRQENNTVAQPENKKSNEEIADEVIKGKWGNGQERKDKLTNAGYDAFTIQKIVNEKLSGNTSLAKKSNEEIANEVIAGKWGNGQERKDRLTSAGYDATAIQKIVNEKLK